MLLAVITRISPNLNSKNTKGKGTGNFPGPLPFLCMTAQEGRVNLLMISANTHFACILGTYYNKKRVEFTLGGRSCGRKPGS